MLYIYSTYKSFNIRLPLDKHKRETELSYLTFVNSVARTAD